VLKVVTSGQMRDLEQHAAAVGLPSNVLMENAGLAVAREVKRFLGGVAGRRILTLVGPGNNGGDGLVAARYLHDWGAFVHLYLVRSRDDADVNYRLVRERAIDTILAGEGDSLVALESLLPSMELIVDAVFGTGKTRPLKGAVEEVFLKVGRVRDTNRDLRVLAVDVPSGLDADTGEMDGACLPTDVTVTLAYPKLGLFCFPGASRVGRIVVADIGVPLGLAEDISTELATAEKVRRCLPGRPLDANKGTFGRVLVVGGSINYIGAVYLACAAATRVGAGLVTLATTRTLQTVLAPKLTEVTYFLLPESEQGVLAPAGVEAVRSALVDYDVLLLGCGLGRSRSAAEFVRALLFSSLDVPSLVIDADALNILAKIPQWWQELPRDAVLTPHPGEMSRLCGLSVDEIQSKRMSITREVAHAWQKTVVLKGAYTVVAAPDGRAVINPVANPGLASAGTGDVLAGAVAGLMAQRCSLFDAAVAGAFLHGQAGEMVKKEVGDAGMLASDLLPVLPLVISKTKGGSLHPEGLIGG
jgi:hydroxyethylthiazole kinase-like uncharacterized protein yjeF